jgi:hypothetical protein
MKTKQMVRIALMSLLLTVGLTGASMAQRGGHGGGHHGKGHNGRDKSYDQKEGKRNLSDKIYRITQADSVQKIKMKPLVDKASKRMETLRASYQAQEKKVLDSLRTKLKPILKEEQLKRLDDFGNRSRK